jgi:hypothetical protein
MSGLDFEPGSILPYPLTNAELFCADKYIAVLDVGDQRVLVFTMSSGARQSEQKIAQHTRNAQ